MNPSSPSPSMHFFQKNALGHPVIEGKVGGEPIALLIDTGASRTVVDLAWCQERKIPLVDTGRKGGGAGGAHLSIYALDGVVITLGGLPLQVASLFALDLAHVNAGLKQQGAEPVGGVIGADVLSRYRAVLDFGSNSVLLRGEGPPAPRG